jgi:peroxiredoxin
MSIDNRKGERAPDYALKDRAGREIRLMDFEGHWLLMVFHRHLA